MSTQRTETATPRRRAEARRRGNVARSQDLTGASALLMGLLAAALTLPRGGQALAAYLHSTLGGLTEAAAQPGGAHAVLLRGLLAGASIVAPIVAATAVTGAAISVVQTGGLFTGKPLEPDLQRINPLRGLQRLFSLRAVVETTKGLLKIAVVAVIVVVAIRGLLPRLPDAIGQGPGPLMALLGTTALAVVARGALALLAIGLLDYIYQRFEWERSIRMTKQEVREELRETEGDPLVRSRQRARARELARRRMMADVPKATVVVTNPTHIAVALRYVPRVMAAPVVVAKGTRAVAERIRAIAAQHDVPIVQNAPLARSLHKAVPVGRAIPPALYHAVAEVLAALYRLARRHGTPA